ncbi:MAG: hypothetical protein H6742_09775 [Alphaproteobacteria bacterium]|nr:hypothetical protein [Alphaproteobacteria bacterium]
MKPARMSLVACCLLLGVGGCAIFKNPNGADSGTGGTDGSDGDTDATDTDASDGDTDADTDTDVSTSTDTDGTDTDTDTDADADTDGGIGDELCDRTLTTGGPRDDCVTYELTCDAPVIDTIEGGRADFGAEAYQNWYCGWASGDPWAGPERVYTFEHPGTGEVEITLESPCVDLDLIALRWAPWAEEEECPITETLISECEMDDSRDGGSVTLWSNEPVTYLVIVDSVDDERDNFALVATCP